jgi:predicted dinucleotide-binding enzyme
MDIGIIGAGHIGATLAGHLTRVGHRVAIANSRGPETLSDLVAELGPRAHAATIDEAASFGRVVIAALPFGQFHALPAADIGDRILVDATNYFRRRDGAMELLEQGETTSSEMIAAHASDARVVKAFNTIRWEQLRDEARPAGDDRRALPIAGDDADAKKIVADLIDQIGFDTVDAGALASGRVLQPGSGLFLSRLNREELRRRLASG